MCVLVGLLGEGGGGGSALNVFNAVKSECFSMEHQTVCYIDGYELPAVFGSRPAGAA